MRHHVALAMLVVVVGAARSARPAVHRAPTFDVEISSNVVYGRGLQCADASQKASGCEPIDLLLDVTSPVVAPESPRPALLLVHGGGWTGGTFHDGWVLRAAEFYASRGFVTFGIKYRLEKDHGSYPTSWPSQAQKLTHKAYPATRDLKAAIRFVRANAARFGVDPGRIALAGGSAGAVSSIAAGVVDEGDYKDELLATDPTLATTNLKTSSEVQCVVSHWGAGYAALVAQAADPSNRSRYSASSAPIIEFHGDEDHTVPLADALAVEAAYQQANTSGTLAYQMVLLPSCGHSAWCATPAGCPAPDQCDAQDTIALPFVAQHLDLDLQGQSPTPSPAPAPSPSSACQAFCSKNAKSWSIKCAWTNCGGCAECQGSSEHLSFSEVTV